jgi:hypothetical protein
VDRIEAKVARVLSADSLVINRGSDHGVEIGMRFRVLNRRGLAIVDPDTGLPLGDAEISKAEVKVISVESGFATARTFRTYTGGMADMFPGVFGRQIRETLEVDSNIADEAKVREGDPVIQVTEA